MPSHHLKAISYPTFQDLLSRYPSHIAPSLHHLDSQRYETIPAAAAPHTDNGGPHLTKPMLETLVEWKLKHGTFRPRLLDLVRSNDAEGVREVVGKADAVLGQAGAEVEARHVLSAVKMLVQLKGVGPATASLVLSVLRPAEVPFFSDELLRWCCWEEGRGAGWKSGIKYTAKEYGVVVERVMEVRRRLGVERVQAVQVEKVAWVLGKEGIDVGAGDEEEEGERCDHKGYNEDGETSHKDEDTPAPPTHPGAKSNRKKRTPEEDVDATSQPPPKTSKKTAAQKDTLAQAPVPDTRRSSRIKK